VTDEVEVVPDGPSRFVVRIGGRDQSYVHVDDPTRLEFDYVRRMGDVIDLHRPPGEPVRCVHVGGGGLTLPRYVAATRPRSGQIVLEPATEVTELVRELVPLPPRSGIKVRPVEGRAGLEALRDSTADLLVIDAFDEGRVPAGLLTAECFATTRRVLAPDGLLLLNLVDRAPFALARRVVAGLRSAYPHLLVSAEPATLRGRREGNLLLVAGQVPVPVEPLRQRAASSPLPYRVLDERGVGSSFGGGEPLRDASP
jgi:spermidine synthase